MAIAVVLGITGCEPHTTVPQGISVYFSPNGGATQAIVQALAGATNSVRVQAFSFTSGPIAEALVRAMRRGVDVRVILDDSQKSEKYSESDFLVHNGISTLMDGRHAIAHNKVIIVDERIVITGSFNFTRAAEERNAENLLMIDDPKLAVKYLANWAEHAAHSDEYARPGEIKTRPARRR